MKVLITGAAGLLGRALLDRLQQRGDLELHGIDQRPFPLATAHLGDLLQPEFVGKLIAELQPDQIYHLAGTFSNDFQTDFSSNVATTRLLLDAVVQHQPAARLLLIGSAAEYGLVRPEENPIREDHALAPVSMYGWAKVCQTQLMGYYQRVRGVDVCMARLFNLSGPASPRLFIGRLYQQIDQLRRGEITEIVTGPLGAVRDYLAPEAAAELLEGIMQQGSAGEVYHVASGVPVTMRELMQQVLHQEGLSDCKVREETRALPGKLDIPCIHADMTKTRDLLRPGQDGAATGG
ncbi:MAG: NAD-dependent epimerase/dehydratase family protein [Verrucomicrobiota bacterium]